MALHELVVDFLDLPINLLKESSADAFDFRGKVGVKQKDTNQDISDVEYWQVWKERYGFQADMSIFDLLMNTGRESIFTLMAMNTVR